MFTKRSFLMACGFVLILLVAGGCYRPSEYQECSDEEITWVVNVSPFDIVVNTLTPTISWSYPDETCVPDHYEISIYDRDVIRSIPREERMRYYADGPVHSVETTDLFYSVPEGAGLQAGQTYFLTIDSVTDDGEVSATTGWFTIGPLCHEDTILHPPVLVYPPDNTMVYFPDTIDLEWNNPMPCVPAEDYYLEIATTEDFSEMTWWGTTHYREVTWISNGPPLFSDCTRYYWRVRSDPAGADEGPYSETWSFLMSWSEVFCLAELDPVFDTEPLTLPPMAEMISDASCRSGPSLDYPILEYIESGQNAPVQGRNEENTWWYILNPGTQNMCWISGRVIRLSGDYIQVPFIPVDPPPLPDITDTPAFDCSAYNTNPQACISTAGNYCRWDASIGPNGACVNR